VDYVNPNTVVVEALERASKQADFFIRDVWLRSLLAGAVLGSGTYLKGMVDSQRSIVGAILFPAGLVMLVLLGLELSTGGARISMGRWWSWNQITVTLGNRLSAVVLRARVFYPTYGAKLRVGHEESAVEPAAVSLAFATEASAVA